MFSKRLIGGSCGSLVQKIDIFPPGPDSPQLPFVVRLQQFQLFSRVFYRFFFRLCSLVNTQAANTTCKHLRRCSHVRHLTPESRRGSNFLTFLFAGSRFEISPLSDAACTPPVCLEAGCKRPADLLGAASQSLSVPSAVLLLYFNCALRSCVRSHRVTI